MMIILPLINASVFILLALLHLYWMIGGHWGYLAVIPTDGNGRKLFRPGALATLVVSLGLILFAITNLIYSGCFPFVLPKIYLRVAMLAIAVIFLLRAIGDFRYVGFSKRFRTTRFAKMDTLLFSPLCLALAVSHGVCFLVCR